jgi:hypothetical protein
MAKPPRDAWKTFQVSVREIRGERSLEAVVSLSHVPGVIDRPVGRHIVWAGPIGERLAGSSLTPEEAAEYAVAAIRKAYPGLL